MVLELFGESVLRGVSLDTPDSLSFKSLGACDGDVNESADSYEAKLSELLSQLDRDNFDVVVLDSTIGRGSTTNEKVRIEIGIAKFLELAVTKIGIQLPVPAIILNRDCSMESSEIEKFEKNGTKILEFDGCLTENQFGSQYRDHSLNGYPRGESWVRRALTNALVLYRLDEQDISNFTEVKCRMQEALEKSYGLDEDQVEVDTGDYKGHIAYRFKDSKDNPDNLLVIYFNGAIDPKRAEGKPVFQRKSWWPELPGDSASCADPTQNAFKDLALGWGQGTRQAWGIPVQAAMVSALISFWRKRCGLRIDEGTVVLYGSSGGGFQALEVGTLLRVDRVLVNNPQLDWLKYEGRKHVIDLMQKVYGPWSNHSGFRGEWAERISVLEFWEGAGFVPAFDLFVNAFSSPDIRNQVAPLLSKMGNEKAARKFENVSIRYYTCSEDGHSPLLTRELLGIVSRPPWELISWN